MATFQKGKSKFLLKPIDVKTESGSFDGKIYHLLGQGLGDTVNALRIVSTIQSVFSQSNQVLYCDSRWKDLIPPGQPWTIHWYPEARDPRHPERGVVSPYQESLGEILSAAGKNDRLGYYSYLLPDQLALGESTQEMIARKLGLSELLPDFRPFVHVSPSDWEKADKILDQHGLKKGRFFTMAPHTWPDKSWSVENFEELGKKAWKEYGAKSVVLGLPELKAPMFEGGVPVFGIPLPVVAAIIARSCFFIGLDSGLSHVAASFDIPLAVLYSQGKIPAFEIRVHSPYAELILEPVPGHPIEVKTVLNVLRFRMEHGSGLTLRSPICPACGRTMQYIVEASEEALNRRCFCGTQFLQKREGRWDKAAQQVDALGEDEQGKENDPISSDNPRKKDSEIENQSFWNNMECLDHQRWSIRVSCKNPFSHLRMADLDRSSEKSVFFSMDGTFFFLQSSGFHILSVAPAQHFDRKKELILCIEISKEHRHPGRILLPWGKGTLFLDSMEDYFSYFSWQSWATSLRWTGLSKRVYEWGKKEDAVRVARILFRMDPSVKTVKYCLRYLWLSLWDMRRV